MTIKNRWAQHFLVQLETSFISLGLTIYGMTEGSKSRFYLIYEMLRPPIFYRHS